MGGRQQRAVVVSSLAARRWPLCCPPSGGCIAPPATPTGLVRPCAGPRPHTPGLPRAPAGSPATLCPLSRSEPQSPKMVASMGDTCTRTHRKRSAAADVGKCRRGHHHASARSEKQHARAAALHARSCPCRTGQLSSPAAPAAPRIPPQSCGPSPRRLQGQACPGGMRALHALPRQAMAHRIPPAAPWRLWG